LYWVNLLKGERLSIVGCPDKTHFRPYVKRAALYYAEQLISPKLRENIYLRIKFNPKIEVYGYAQILEYNESRKAREFEIELNPNIGAAEILKTLAHEMTHIKQYAYSETNETLTRWKGLRLNPDNIDYWEQPWEIEAHGMETGLFQKFAIKEKLWEVFKDICNPDDPIEMEPLGWK